MTILEWELFELYMSLAYSREVVAAEKSLQRSTLCHFYFISKTNSNDRIHNRRQPAGMNYSL